MSKRLTQVVQHAALVLAGWLVVGCSAYDPGLLELSSTKSQLSSDAGRGGAAAGAAGTLATAGSVAGEDAGATAGSLANAGTSGTAGSGVTVGPGSGAAGAAGSGMLETTRCGDGLITGSEKCDLGIEAGQSGACPTECPALANCSPRALNGTGCQSECVLLTLSCKPGDGCCPGECTASNDADCSASCGDGIVQTERGETCEPSSKQPCKVSDSDCADSDPCTSDKLTGSAQNCNAACLNAPIIATIAGDGCCPSSGNANTDSDCSAKCGNGVRESGEECDGGTGCSAACKLTLQPQQLSCLERFGTDDCARCSCMNCVDTYLACRANTDATASTNCTAVIDCARPNNCLGTSCYCTDPAFCAFTPGPCKAPIETAAGTTNPFVISDQSYDVNTAVGRAYAADRCRVAQCADVCRSKAQ